LFGDVPPKIEFKNITFKKPEQSNYVGAKYNNLRFSDNELPIIFNGLMERRDKFPFQAEALLFLKFSGRRVPETLKMKPGAINKERGVIILNYGTTKGRKEEYVDITPPIKLVLDSLEYQLKKPEFQKYRFVDWLFPTTRINSERLHEDSYVRSEATRLKSLRGCWNDLIKQTGIIGSPKMFRKTFSSIAKLTLGTSSKARALTGHEQDSTLDVHYDKTSRETAKEYAHQVAEVFNFIKKTG
jgi:integrase